MLLESGPVSRSVGKPQRLISRFAGPTFHCDDVTDSDHHDHDDDCNDCDHHDHNDDGDDC